MSTIVIHGTLAPEEPWWHVARPGGFLDHLARGMQQGGCDPDVWMIAGQSVAHFAALRPQISGTVVAFQQIDGHFKWTGHNAHVMRLHEGVQLANYLNALSAISPYEPIDIVAHSHGCNLVKVATNHIGRHVRLGRIAFLAAPHCENVAGASSKYLYPLNAPFVCADAGGPHCVLNVYSDEDPVQTKLAGAGLDYITAPGTPFSPVFNALRVDPDPAAQYAYDNLRLETHMGHRDIVHTMMHSPTVGLLVGFWLATWPQFTGDECRRHFGINVLTDTNFT